MAIHRVVGVDGAGRGRMEEMVADAIALDERCVLIRDRNEYRHSGMKRLPASRGRVLGGRRRRRARPRPPAAGVRRHVAAASVPTSIVGVTPVGMDSTTQDCRG